MVKFDSKIESDNFIWHVTSDTKREETEKEVISFDQLHINAVHQRFVSADEMKFLILVDKLLSSGDTKYTSSSEIKQALYTRQFDSLIIILLIFNRILITVRQTLKHNYSNYCNYVVKFDAR